MAASILYTVSVLLLGLVHHVAAAALPQPTPHDDGCVHLPIIHSTNVNFFSGKRGIQMALANRSDIAYYAQLSIGTPPQPVFVQLDTGSFELWVNPDCSKVRGADALFCERVGQYDTSRSSTVTSLGTSKFLKYGIGSANISYVTDTITLAGSATSLRNVQFGVATSSSDTFSGILGIGYGQGIATKYPNFVDQLHDQSAIRVKAYTLALGSKDAREGIVVFGGVDTAKFSGKLARVPIIPADRSPDRVPRFWVDLRSITLTPPSGISRVYEDSARPVFLDSGSTMTLLPRNLTAAIARDFGANEPDSNGFYRIDCALTQMSGTLDFAFDGVTVKVPYKELTREVPTNPPACFLGIMASDKFTLLGDTFLRSAYAVFDLESDSIWLSQATNCGSSPAALDDINSLATITGDCGGSGVVDSSTSVPTSTSEAIQTGVETGGQAGPVSQTSPGGRTPQGQTGTDGTASGAALPLLPTGLGRWVRSWALLFVFQRVVLTCMW